MTVTKSTLLWLLNEFNFSKPFSYDDVLDSLKGDCFKEAQLLGALQICGQVSNLGCKYCEDRHPILPSSKNEVFCPKYGKRFFVDENKTYLYSVHYKWLKETLCNIGSIIVTQHQDVQQNLHLLGNINLLYAEYLVYLYCDPDFSFAKFNKIIDINPIDDNSIILSLNDTDELFFQSPYNFIKLEHIISTKPTTNNAFICTKTLANHIKKKNRTQCKTPENVIKADDKRANNFPRALIVWAIIQLEEQGVIVPQTSNADLVSKTWSYLKDHMNDFSYELTCGSIHHPIKMDHNGFYYNNSDKIQTTYKKTTFDRFAKGIRKTYLSDYEKYKELLANQTSTKQ